MSSEIRKFWKSQYYLQGQQLKIVNLIISNNNARR